MPLIPTTAPSILLKTITLNGIISQIKQQKQFIFRLILLYIVNYFTLFTLMLKVIFGQLRCTMQAILKKQNQGVW